MINEILLRNKNKIYTDMLDAKTEADHSEKDEMVVAQGLSNIEALGFTFSPKLYESCRNAGSESFIAFYKELYPMLQRTKGANTLHRPFYPNFPKEVKEMPQLRLYVNAILHYLTDGEFRPMEEPMVRFPLLDTEKKYIVLDLGTKEDLDQFFVDLLASSSSLSAQNKEDIVNYMKTNADYMKYVPESIPEKETAAVFVKTALSLGTDSKELLPFVRTATDVLRLAIAFGDGDVSLAPLPKNLKDSWIYSDEDKRKYQFHLRKKERRWIMYFLDHAHGTVVEDMFLNRERWKRLAECIHPQSMKGYPKATAYFTDLKGHKPQTILGKAEDHMAKKEWKEAALVLKERPGLLLRALDRILRQSGEEAMDILAIFADVADKVSIPALLQARNHFLGRKEDDPVRVFFIKDTLGRAFVKVNDLPPLSDELIGQTLQTIEDGIKTQLSTRPSLGKVYLSEEMKDFMIPTSERAGNDAFGRSLTRGSRISFAPNTKFLRPFIWWTNAESGERVDLDLSMLFVDENWASVGHVSYTNLKESELGCLHSGDIVNGGDFGGEGVSEFIDLDIEKAKKAGAKYAIFQIYAYTSLPFGKIPNHFGFMERQDSEMGEIFEPQTTDGTYSLVNGTRTAVPCIFDLENRTMIWCDMSMNINPYWKPNNLEQNLMGGLSSAYAIVHGTKTSMYDMVWLNVDARKDTEFVDSPEKADIIFRLEETPVLRDEEPIPIITPFDKEYFTSNLM